MQRKVVTSDDDADDNTPEKVIEDLGGCGRYQMRMCVISHIMKTLICWSCKSIVIITKTPEFWCNDYTTPINMTSEKDANATMQYDAHKSCVNANGSSCASFRFDDSVVRSIVNEYDLVCEHSFVPSTLMSIQSAGLLFGNLLIGQIADLFGRKVPFFSAVLMVTVADFVQLAAHDWVLIAVCKFFVGIGSGAFMTTTYSLMSEFTLARHRVWIIGFPSWPIEACVFCLLAWLVKDWRYMTLACGVVGIPCLFAWWVIPESFRWLLAHGRQNEAEKILDDVANHNDMARVESKRLDAIAAAEEVEKVKDRKYTLLDMFRSKYLIRVTILMAVNWFGMGFVGYGIVFGIQELSGSIYFNLFLFSIVGIPAKGIAIWTQNRFGRKLTSIFCYGGAALSCFIVAAVQNIDTDSRDSMTNGFALLANTCITMLWGSIQTMTVELYPTVIRNIGFGTLSVIGRIGAIIAPQVVFLGKLIGIPGFMYFCSGFVATMCVLALFGLSETKDSNLSDTIVGSKFDSNHVHTDINGAEVGKRGSFSPDGIQKTENYKSKTIAIESDVTKEEPETTNTTYRTENGKWKTDVDTFNDIKMDKGELNKAKNESEIASVQYNVDVNEPTVEDEDAYKNNVEPKWTKTGQIYHLQQRL